MALEQFARFCRDVLTDPAGRPLGLYPEQLEMLGDYFDGVRETLIVMPKKSGKSSLAAALSLYHLVTTPFAEAYIAAASRDQAARVLDALAGFVRRSPELGSRVRLKQREAVHDGNAGFVRVLAADTDTSDGVTPSLAIVDELHRHKSGELAGLLRDGLGPRDGRMLTISTAGDDESTPLGKLRARAYTLPGMVREAAHRYVRSGDSFAFHEWALDPDADVDDLELVKSANPAPWVTLEELRERHDSPSTTPWQWRRFACGIWMAGEDSAISDVEWRACAAPDLEVPEGSEGVHVGIDLGWKHDPTALVPVWRADGAKSRRVVVRRTPQGFRHVRPVEPAEQGSVHVGRPTILTPPGDGTSLPVEDVFAACEAMVRKWPRLTFVLDPLAGGEHLAQRLDAELPKVTVATHSQAHSAMCLASARLSEAIAEGRLRHPDDAELSAHVLAAGVRQVGEQWRFAKQRGRDAPIDACIALAMAFSTIVSEQPRRSKGRAVGF